MEKYWHAINFFVIIIVIIVLIMEIINYNMLSKIKAGEVNELYNNSYGYRNRVVVDPYSNSYGYGGRQCAPQYNQYYQRRHRRSSRSRSHRRSRSHSHRRRCSSKKAEE